MDNDYQQEEYYYCTTGWLIDKNPTRVFRLSTVNDQEGTEYFYPMVDHLYLKKGEHTDSNGLVYFNVEMDNMRIAKYSEVNRYILSFIKNKEDINQNKFTLYDNSPKLKNLFKDMKNSFQRRGNFPKQLNYLDGFLEQDIYHFDEKIILNLLRSYYKCRINKINL